MWGRSATNTIDRGATAAHVVALPDQAQDGGFDQQLQGAGLDVTESGAQAVALRGERALAIAHPRPASPAHADDADNFHFVYAQMKNLRRKLAEAGATVELKSV